MTDSVSKLKLVMLTTGKEGKKLFCFRRHGSFRTLPKMYILKLETDDLLSERGTERLTRELRIVIPYALLVCVGGAIPFLQNWVLEDG
jgi:hypothetical protein